MNVRDSIANVFHVAKRVEGSLYSSGDEIDLDDLSAG